MAYVKDGFARFVGMECITGRLEVRDESFVLQHSATHEKGISTGALMIVPGSATGELEGLEGEGDYKLGHEDVNNYKLEYTLP